VYDLDLFIESPSGKIFTSNGQNSGGETSLSTQEKIVIDNVEIGKYLVHVVFPHSPYEVEFDENTSIAQYSLVINGPFPHYSEPLVEQPGSLKCLNKGTNSDGFCICPTEFTGLRCQIPVVNIEKNKPIQVTVSPRSEMYFYFKHELGKNIIIDFTGKTQTEFFSLFLNSNRSHKIISDSLFVNSSKNIPRRINISTTNSSEILSNVDFLYLGLISNFYNTFDVSITLSFDPDNTLSTTFIVLIVVLVILVFVVACFCAVFWWKRRKLKLFSEMDNNVNDDIYSHLTPPVK
jgi:hypothetical protein